MHHLPVHDALLLLKTDPERGLSSAEAGRRLTRHGPNVMPRVERRGWPARVAAQLHNPLVYVLLVAAVVTYAIGETVNTAVILGVVFANTVVGFVQESRAESALDALAQMITVTARVVRDGQERSVSSRELVPGDVVAFEAGDKLAADLRLISVAELHVDESALTGESVPVIKEQVVLAPQTVLADRANMAFSGTLVTTGRGRGVVVATGAETELGQMHRLLAETTELETPLTRRLT
ncbi:MAG TPA: HAD-IC family P-type ATPase, partial [Solirubrobacteraceae bacterium]|nr:HAD-IC family P-type ATPase [Solirubrobacteraceae bacterium]